MWDQVTVIYFYGYILHDCEVYTIRMQLAIIVLLTMCNICVILNFSVIHLFYIWKLYHQILISGTKSNELNCV
jgi:hypothetical protein